MVFVHRRVVTAIVVVVKPVMLRQALATRASHYLRLQLVLHQVHWPSRRPPRYRLRLQCPIVQSVTCHLPQEAMIVRPRLTFRRVMSFFLHLLWRFSDTFNVKLPSSSEFHKTVLLQRLQFT